MLNISKKNYRRTDGHRMTAYTARIASRGKNRQFFVPQLSFFCLPWGRPCGNHAKRCMNEKTIFSACQTPRSMYPSIQQFSSYSNRKCKKSPFSRTAGHIFVSPGDALRLSRNMLHAWKDNSMLAKPLAACTGYLSSIVSELYDA